MWGSQEAWGIGNHVDSANFMTYFHMDSAISPSWMQESSVILRSVWLV